VQSFWNTHNSPQRGGAIPKHTASPSSRQLSLVGGSPVRRMSHARLSPTGS
jgi:hypothetical protein